MFLPGETTKNIDIKPFLWVPEGGVNVQIAAT